MYSTWFKNCYSNFRKSILYIYVISPRCIIVALIQQHEHDSECQDGAGLDVHRFPSHHPCNFV